MATAKTTRFKGDPQDYLDWFTLGYEKENEISLPGSSFLESKAVTPTTSVPIYRRDELGTSYSEAYIAQHNEDFKNNVNLLPHLLNKSNTKLAKGMEDVSTIADVDPETLANKCTNKEKTQVYLHYNFKTFNEDSRKLPVFNKKTEILQKIASYSVVIIQGYTGCGKSTQVPQFILDDAVENNQHANVIVTQPRKIAAISLASRVCEERKWSVGTLVGYQVGLNNMCELDTRLAYVTTEVLVQKIIHKKSLDEYTHIILDEIHERDRHMDFALLIIKKLLHTVSKHVKVILMSATIDCNQFARYFATPLESFLIPAPVISIVDKMPHNIQIYYLDSLKAAFVNKQTPPYSFESPGISQEMFHLARNLVMRFDNLERQQENKGQTELPSNRGAVLMFLPGLNEIEKMIELLRKDADERRWETYPLHSTLTLDEQRSVFKKAKPGIRKIIVSTTIAESSITVPDIKYVIDFCLTKLITTDPVTYYTSLKMAWTSKASCTQRAGRVGRVSAGRVYRLVEDFFFNDFDDHTTPEMQRTPLSQVVLKIKQLDMGEPQALLALALNPPNLTEIHRTVLALKQIGALELKSGDKMSHTDGNLTFLGRIAANLPLDPKLSKLIVMGYLFGCLKETVIIAAGLSLRSFHSSPFQDELNAFLSKVSWAHASFSDCLAIYNTYFVWENHNLRGKFLPTGSSKEREWARSSYIQLEALREVDKLVKELNQRLDQLKITKRHDTSPQDKEIQAFFIKICIAGAFYPNYFQHSVPDDYEMTICRELSGHDPFSSLVVSGLPTETNFLYDNQIKTLFKNCSNNLKVSYEGSKAYITFPRKKLHEEQMKSIPGEYPTAMYLALKMKHIHRIKQTLHLQLLSPEETAEHLKSMVAKKDISDFTKKRERVVQCSSFVFSPPVLPPPTCNFWKLRVTHAESPARFWGISNNAQCSEHMSYIHSLIEMDMAKNSSPLTQKMLSPKLACLAPFTDPETLQENYYRAQIEEIDENNTQVLVYFVDYGNNSVVPFTKLRPLTEGLLTIPMLAVPCALSEVKPASFGLGITENVWSKEATAWLNNCLIYKDFLGQIYSVIHNVIRLELFDHDSQQSNSVSINKQLIDKGFASKAKEFVMSSRNHNLRGILIRELPYGESRFLGPPMSPSSDYQLNITSPGAAPSSSRMGMRITQRLKGPYSPLEMTFVPLFRSGCLKGVKVDPSSVNSTSLDLEPQSPYHRLIVASSVDLNPGESHIILRNSTQMPALPGMLSLALLMFCPFGELRVSEDHSEYTGALFGLGSDPETGEAIYPDEDIEIAFDFKFTQSDLQKINGLRYLMSSTLECFDEISVSKLLNLQKSMKSTVLEIVNDKREFVQPVMFYHAYKWNQVHPDKILHPQTPTEIEKNTTIVWGLHEGVILQPKNQAKVLSNKLKALRRLEARLKDERRVSSFSVDEWCPACRQKLPTFAHLQVHLSLESHLTLESRSYGLPGS